MPNLQKREKWMEELNDRPGIPFKFPSVNTDFCYCLFCEKTFVATQKSQVAQHKVGEKHKKNSEVKKKRTASQANLNEMLGRGQKQSR